LLKSIPGYHYNQMINLDDRKTKRERNCKRDKSVLRKRDKAEVSMYGGKTGKKYGGSE